MAWRGGEGQDGEGDGGKWEEGGFRSRRHRVERKENDPLPFQVWF